MNGTAPAPILTAAPDTAAAGCGQPPASADPAPDAADAIRDRPAAVRPTVRALPGAAPPSPCRPGRPGEEHPEEAA
ncbi:hypothetical protein LG634_21290 [Streptomyces bambusae]|uniref:hypothetical protein n=1 Tax=Streptomyces bambusae TaxID=1550616 RepID=UPI001CFE82DA|nr:hypothetical protein [Streptomyces bambusae]MCB5167363.1 hypothetical protein [Streptomyces bambusae]